jgi:cytoskeletal protein CcmA (bactofilin family)
MKNSGILILALLFWIPSLPVKAAQVKADQSVLISQPIADDAYLAGGKVTINGKIGGDAVVAGGHLFVNGPVGEDLLIAGGNVTINGKIGGDVRAAGGDVTISRDVMEDLIVCGGNVIVGPGVTVGGDLLMAGGRVTLEGSVEGNAEIVGGEVVIDGMVRGSTRLRAAERLQINGKLQGPVRFAAPQVTLGPEAAFGGDVEYWRKEGPFDFAGVRIAGTATYNPDLETGVQALEGVRQDKAGPVIFAVCMLLSLLSGALVILILVLATRAFFRQAAASLRESFWKHAGLGFLYFVVTPVVGFLLLLSVLGIPLGLFVLFGYFFSIYFAMAVTALVLGRWIEQRKRADWSKGKFFWVGFGLFVALKILILVPVAGWLIVAALVCGAFGALMKTKWQIYRQVA